MAGLFLLNQDVPVQCLRLNEKTLYPIDLSVTSFNDWYEQFTEDVEQSQHLDVPTADRVSTFLDDIRQNLSLEEQQQLIQQLNDEQNQTLIEKFPK